LRNLPFTASTSASTKLSTESIIDNTQAQDNLMGQSQEPNLAAEPLAFTPCFEGQDGRPLDVDKTGLSSWPGNASEISSWPGNASEISDLENEFYRELGFLQDWS
jgi:hypothetical protein